MIAAEHIAQRFIWGFLLLVISLTTLRALVSLAFVSGLICGLRKHARLRVRRSRIIFSLLGATLFCWLFNIVLVKNGHIDLDKAGMLKFRISLGPPWVWIIPIVTGILMCLVFIRQLIDTRQVRTCTSRAERQILVRLPLFSTDPVFTKRRNLKEWLQSELISLAPVVVPAFLQEASHELEQVAESAIDWKDLLALAAGEVVGTVEDAVDDEITEDMEDAEAISELSKSQERAPRQTRPRYIDGTTHVDSASTKAPSASGPTVARSPDEIVHNIPDAFHQQSTVTVPKRFVAPSDAARARRLLTEANQIVHGARGKGTQISGRTDEHWLAQVAKASACIDLALAEQFARAIPGEYYRAWALEDIAKQCARTDPAHAEQVARAITGRFWDRYSRDFAAGPRARALASVANAYARTDPGHADQLINEATQIALRIRDKNGRDEALAGVAKAFADSDPNRAEQIARGIPEGLERDKPLLDIVRASARTDPARAEQILSAFSPFASSEKEWARAIVAKAYVGTDPARAEQIARALHETRRAEVLVDLAKAYVGADLAHVVQIARDIHNEFYRAIALRDIASACAPTDPGRAEQIAREISSASVRAHALAIVAEASTDPAQVKRLINDANQIASAIQNKDERAGRQGYVARVRASTDPAHAEQIARGISLQVVRAPALVQVANAYADTDPARAERLMNDAIQIAYAIRDQNDRAHALARIVGECAPTDPGRAEQIAREIPEGRDQTLALESVAKAYVGTDPARAEQVARGIPYDIARALALVKIAYASSSGSWPHDWDALLFIPL